MNKRRLQHPLHANKEILCAIGDIAVSFALLEFEIDFLLAAASSDRLRHKPITLQDMKSAGMGFGMKAQKLRKIIVIPNDLPDRIKGLGGRRGEVMHDVHLASGPDGTDLIKKGRVSSVKRLQLTDLQNLAREIQETADEVQREAITRLRRQESS